jgi:hypothetical protein
MKDLKPKFITNLQDYFRKIKLGWYKKKKVNESKTSHKRYYHMKFKIHVDDELNPQESDINYEMVVPARAAFFAKILLERSIKEKIFINVVDWEEMTDEEHEELVKSRDDYSMHQAESRIDLAQLPSEKEFDEWINENVIQLSDGNVKTLKRAKITDWIREHSASKSKD